MEPQTNTESAENTDVSAVPATEEKKESTAEPTKDVSEYRTFAIVGYILPFLFFLPLIDEKTKNVPFARFHANQQLIILVLGVAVYMLQGLLFGPFMMMAHYVIQILNLALLALIVIGVINAYKSEMKELPFVGQFRLIK